MLVIFYILKISDIFFYKWHNIKNNIQFSSFYITNTTHENEQLVKEYYYMYFSL